MRYYQRRELVAKIREVALLEGDFVLRSGKRSHYYLDKYLFEGYPDILRSLAHHMARLVPEDIDRLAGVELGGIPITTALSLETDIPCVFIRKSQKDYGTEKIVEGAYEPSDRILLIEDVVTTGGQSIAMVQQLREEMDLTVTGVLCVLDRMEGSHEAFAGAGIPFTSFLTRDDLGF